MVCPGQNPFFQTFKACFFVEPTFAARVPSHQTRGANADWHPVLPEPRGTDFLDDKDG